MDCEIRVNCLSCSAQIYNIFFNFIFVFTLASTSTCHHHCSLRCWRRRRRRWCYKLLLPDDAAHSHIVEVVVLYANRSVITWIYGVSFCSFCSKLQTTHSRSLSISYSRARMVIMITLWWWYTWQLAQRVRPSMMCVYMWKSKAGAHISSIYLVESVVVSVQCRPVPPYAESGECPWHLAKNSLVKFSFFFFVVAWVDSQCKTNLCTY